MTGEWDIGHTPCPRFCQDDFSSNRTAFLVEPISDHIAIFCSAMLTVTFVCGIPASILVIICFAKNRSLWTTTNAIIVNISVSDLVMFSISVPLALVVVVMNPQGKSMGLFACKLQTFASSLTNTVTLLTLDAVTLNRYIAMVYPFVGSDGWTKKLDKTLVISSWVAGLLFASVEAAVPNTTSGFYERCLMRKGDLNDSRIEEYALKHAQFYLMAPLGAFSMLFVTVVYIKILCIVRRHHRKVTFAGSHSPSGASVASAKAYEHFEVKRSPFRKSQVTVNPIRGDPAARSNSSVSEAAALAKLSKLGSRSEKLNGTILSASYLNLPGTDVHMSPGDPRKSATSGVSGFNVHRRKSSVCQQTIRHRAGMKATASKRSVYIVMAFFTAWIPLPSIIILSMCYPLKKRIIDELMTLFYCVMLTSRLAHPFLYANFSKEFHKEFKKIWRAVSKQKPAVDISIA